MQNKIDYQLGKDCFEKFLHELEDDGNDLSKSGLDKLVQHSTITVSAICSSVVETMVKYHVPYDTVKNTKKALLDMSTVIKIASEVVLVKKMLYGKGDTSGQRTVKG